MGRRRGESRVGLTSFDPTKQKHVAHLFNYGWKGEPLTLRTADNWIEGRTLPAPRYRDQVELITGMAFRSLTRESEEERLRAVLENGTSSSHPQHLEASQDRAIYRVDETSSQKDRSFAVLPRIVEEAISTIEKSLHVIRHFFVE
jgi:hypothetical protein